MIEKLGDVYKNDYGLFVVVDGLVVGEYTNGKHRFIVTQNIGTGHTRTIYKGNNFDRVKGVIQFYGRKEK